MQKNIRLIDLGLFLVKQKTLVIADLHIGYEEALNKQGILIPRFQLAELLERLERMLKTARPDTVVVNGDIKHEFGSISEQEWRDTLRIIDILSAGRKLVLVKGNHDTILGPIAKKRGIRIVEHYKAGDYYICHGHALPKDDDFRKSKTVIIGHEHPAVTLRKGGRGETFKCFLFGQYKKKQLVVLPSMNLVTEGTDILSEKLLSPFLGNIDRFRVVIIGDGLYDFGLVGSLR